MTTRHDRVANPSPACGADSDVDPVDPEGTQLIEILELPLELRGSMLLAALDLDPRPTFIFNLEQTYQGGNARQPALVFCNAALNARHALRNVIKAQERKIVATWHSSLLATVDNSGELDTPLMLFALPWEFYTINGRWRVASTTRPAESALAFISSALTPPIAANTRQLQPPLELKAEAVNSRIEASLESTADPSRKAFIDNPSAFIRNFTPLLSSDFGQSLYHFNWASTQLGPIDTWSLQLLEMFKLMLADPRPTILYWGPQNVMLYNEAVVPLMLDRHPTSMGQTIEMIGENILKDLHQPLVARIKKTAQAETHVNTLLCYAKENDFLEEVYADCTSVPVIGADGHVSGVYQSIVEVTEHTLTQRRTNTLSALAAVSVQSRDLKGIWGNITTGLEANDKDIPHMLLYSLDARWGESVTLLKCKLEGSIRWAPKSNVEFETLNFYDQEHVLSNIFQQSMSSDVPLYLHQRQANRSGGEPTFDPSLYLPNFVDDFEPGPFGDPCGRVVVFPIRASITDEPMGFVVWGLNSRQPYNQTYRDFVSLLQRSLAASISSGLRWERELLRSQIAAEQAEMDHASLSAQLLQQTKEARANELRFSRFVQHGPIGICIYAPDGSKAFANEQWYSMTDFPRDGDSTGPSWWAPMIFEEDRAYATEMFTQLLVEQKPVHFEIRLVAPPKQASMAKKISTWTLVSAYPEVSNENALEAIVACFTEITEQKWAAEVERMRTEDAMEAKRQQEAFVDITSHEIRNPLSAVLQSAQEINSICQGQLNEAPDHTTNVSVSIEGLKDAVHAAEIIEQCTLHQKRIVDDILTLSKMDAGLLPVVASPAQPLTIVKKTLDFFLRELSQAATEMRISIDDSYTELDLDWLDVDTGRLSQMLINLTTNAIKFTKQQPERQIELRVGASTGSTRLEAWHLDYLTPTTHKIQTIGCDWPEHECVYLHFSVTDTGTGMTLEEQKTLFARFSQGSARTYTQYGGSGLGLYICRALVEIHGGQIGFSSVPGVGSTFGFFIKSRRSPLSGSRRLSTKHVPSKIVSRELVLNIMLVEDNLINQKVLSRQLSRLGHAVMIANHGQECLDILRQSHFCQESGSSLSVILMDIEMPVMDGLVCASTIRKMEAEGLVHAHVPIIAITGNAREEKVQQAKDAGMDEVVLKPFTVPVLMPLIDKLIQRYGKRIPRPDDITEDASLA
ncbi:hypothetical protein BP5796_10315 [Coleophoma crateriformis]|uniref:histidine kinase n=1 Tax=Coleophoma crateriformis TaxID=565419 RepID=A0A3D8QUT8_9HELO|nr:hypothetical protein BP5796_10315 [Coleophoma crateriformis]